jgi:hypothetical protein
MLATGHESAGGRIEVELLGQGLQREAAPFRFLFVLPSSVLLESFAA